MTKILIVDDHDLTVDVMVDILSAESLYDIYAFTRLPHLNFIKILSPHVIILDAYLQRENSLHLCNSLKQFNAQIIIVSAYIDSSAVAYQHGADAFIKKPFDIDDLLETVDICCKRVLNS